MMAKQLLVALALLTITNASTVPVQPKVASLDEQVAEAEREEVGGYPLEKTEVKTGIAKETEKTELLKADTEEAAFEAAVDEEMKPAASANQESKVSGSSVNLAFEDKVVSAPAKVEAKVVPAHVEAKVVPAKVEAKEASKKVDTKRTTAAETHEQLSMHMQPILAAAGKTAKDSKVASQGDMEGAITDLVMNKAAFMGTPLGATVGKIKAVIDKEMIPAVLDAHKADQAELNGLVKEIHECNQGKATNFKGVNTQKRRYLKTSPQHKACRQDEAIKRTSLQNCRSEEREKKQIKELKCKFYASTSRRVGDTNANRAIVTRGGSERVEVYARRITATICGKPGGKGNGGAGKKSLLDDLLNAKEDCRKTTKAHKDQVVKCAGHQRAYNSRKAKCNAIQGMMDAAACKRAVLTKDACETYAECYKSKYESYTIARKTIITEEKDRKAEWRGLKRMACLIGCFSDGKVGNGEIDACKKKTHGTNHLIIKYPKVPKFQLCQVPKAYPNTPQYKKLQYASLPALAKGRKPAECTGVAEISTVPKKGSPKKCKCIRVTLNGPYSAGPMVRCTNCHDVRRSREKNSCPEGTKIFSPASRTDWLTFIKSAKPVRHPHFIIDVTRPQNGCGGCTSHPMNSGNRHQKTWRTADGSAWWLRSVRYTEPNGDYHASCYLDLWHTPKNPDRITWNDGSCGYHSKSYYCQPKKISTTPKKGSPRSCSCKKVALEGRYSAQVLLRCTQCIDVRRATQKNSCPEGTKIFAPSSRGDWKTFIKSAKPLRAPHWIIDITRPSNGCGGCTRHAMNSKVPQQATWRTSDGAAWWLRSSRYSEPNGDYSANCYLDLWRTPANENAITWNDGRCNYHARSYYCQAIKKKTKKR